VRDKSPAYPARQEAAVLPLGGGCDVCEGDSGVEGLQRCQAMGCMLASAACNIYPRAVSLL
jgi:hypothetical protein